MGTTTLWGALVLTGSVLVVALLVNRFAPKRRPHIRRLLLPLALYLASLVAVWLLPLLGAESRVPTATLVSELLGQVTMINVGAVVIFDLVLRAVRIEPAAIVTDVVIGAGYIISCLSIIKKAGVDLSGIVATSAVVTGVLAISLQATLGNIIGGVALQLDNSIREGDWIQLENGRQGKVRRVRWRHTVIDTRDNDTIIVPNASLLAGNIMILGQHDGAPAPHRMLVPFQVDFRYAPGDVIAAVEQALRSAPIEGVAESPAPNCVCYNFEHPDNDSVIRYILRYYLKDLQRDDVVSSRVRLRIYSALRRAGIPLAIPAQHVFLEQDDPERRERKKQKEQGRRLTALSGLELLAPFTREELTHIADHLIYAPFSAGEAITRQGSVAHYLYILTKGTTEVRVADDAEDKTSRAERVVARIEAPGFFGEMGLMAGEPRHASVVAITDVECYRLEKEAFTKIMRDRPEIAAEISAVLAQRKVELQAVRENLDAEARKRKMAEANSELLASIRKFFGLGEKRRD